MASQYHSRPDRKYEPHSALPGRQRQFLFYGEARVLGVFYIPVRAESRSEEDGSSDDESSQNGLTKEGQRRLTTRERRILKQCELFNQDFRQFRLITTANGWFGMADRFVKSGDELFVLEGCAHVSWWCSGCFQTRTAVTSSSAWPRFRVCGKRCVRSGRGHLR